MSLDVKINGLDDIKEALLGIVPKLRKRAIRNALAEGARIVRGGARAAAPVLDSFSPMVIRGYRKPGTLRKAISVRTSKVARRAGDVGVFVNVKPAKGANRGGRNPNDPFYWKFLGRFQFLEAGAMKLPEALDVFVKAIGPAIAKLNKPKAPAP